jgi:hypothetical protein
VWSSIYVICSTKLGTLRWKGEYGRGNRERDGARKNLGKLIEGSSSPYKKINLGDSTITGKGKNKPPYEDGHGQ